MRVPFYFEFDPREITVNEAIFMAKKTLNTKYEKVGNLEHISTGKIIDDSELHFLQAIYYI